MTSPGRQPIAGRKFLSFFASASLLRYGVAAVILFTVGYYFFRILPLLHQVSSAVSSSGRAGAVSSSLNGLLKEVLFLVFVKIFVLALLVWTDWKRIHAEKLLQKTTGKLRASEDRFRQAYETATIGMGIFKLDGTVISANAKSAQILGYEQEELVGMKISQFMAPECIEDHLEKVAALQNGTQASYKAERRVLRKDGKDAWVRNSVNLLRPENEDAYYFWMSEEITLQRQAHDRLEYLANYDPVTNLPNRRFFEEQLATSLKREAAGDVTLLYLEIECFDFLTGTLGRNVADEVLSELGSRLAVFRSESETIGRLDNHAFGMLLMGEPYDDAAVTRAGELREIFRQAGMSGKHRIPLAVNIGIAYSSEAMLSKTGHWSGRGPGGEKSQTEIQAETLLQFARAAMLEARSRGGGSILVADRTLREQASQRHRIEAALLHGLREQEFRVVFQPQFEVSTGNLVRFEALSRWNSLELGSIPPDRFIPIAEQTGLITEIGRRTLLEALKQARTWTDTGRQIGIAVNISPLQFMRPDFTETVAEILALSDFPPSLLELEITEGVFIRDLNLAVARIRELQRLGLSIALDDFGTGYSSLSYLQRMPINAVKLDRSFVSDLTTDKATVSMVRSVLAMAAALNLRVVTEGVETEQQLDILRTLGCDEAQGFLLGRPEPAEMALMRVLDSPLRPVGMVM